MLTRDVDLEPSLSTCDMCAQLVFFISDDHEGIFTENPTGKHFTVLPGNYWLLFIQTAVLLNSMNNDDVNVLLAQLQVKGCILY